jgi:hypothetical protein
MPRRGASILIAATLVLTGAVLVALQVAASRQNAAVATSPSAGCSPQPCADAEGYVMYVHTVDVSPPIVHMEVSFRVTGRDSMHAEPADFILVDADQHRSRPIFDAAGCSGWPRTDIPDGTSFGPETVCFRPASTRSPLTLSWEPDLGLVVASFPVRIR